MRKFIVSVNGTSYEVEVEEMNNVPTKVEQQNNTQVKQTAPTAPASNGGNATTVSAPMPGTIKKVLVKNGDSIKKGDVLFILEAMKLENEIMAPCSGKITSVAASESSSVNPGDVLCTIA